MTCLAVCAAMRPKSAGVSSHSLSTVTSSVSSSTSMSCAKTVTSPVSGSISERAPRVSSALIIRRYADASAFSIASSTVSNAIPRSRSSSRSESIGIFMLRPFRLALTTSYSSPLKDRTCGFDLVVRHINMLRPNIYGDAGVSSFFKQTLDPMTVSNHRFLRFHDDLGSDRKLEVLRVLERPLEPRRRDLQRVPARDRVREIETPGQLLGYLGHRVEIDASVGIDEDPHHMAAGLASHLDIPQA